MRPHVALLYNDELENSPATFHEVLQQYLSMIKGRLQDAMESPIFICGMAFLDSDDPCHELFLYDTSLDCESHVEPEFYFSRVQPSKMELCGHCACVLESPISINAHLKAPN